MIIPERTSVGYDPHCSFAHTTDSLRSDRDVTRCSTRIVDVATGTCVGIILTSLFDFSPSAFWFILNVAFLTFNTLVAGWACSLSLLTTNCLKCVHATCLRRARMFARLFELTSRAPPPLPTPTTRSIFLCRHSSRRLPRLITRRPPRPQVCPPLQVKIFSPRPRSIPPKIRQPKARRARRSPRQCLKQLPLTHTTGP